MKHRICARGILEENDKILFVGYTDKNKNICYALPGGEQELGDNLKQTVKKEFREEVGIDVEPGDIVLVREFIIDEPIEEIWKGGIHQVEIIFECKRLDYVKIDVTELKSDIDMIDVKWIPIKEFNKFKIYPCEGLKEIILNKRVNYLFSNE